MAHLSVEDGVENLAELAILVHELHVEAAIRQHDVDGAHHAGTLDKRSELLVTLADELDGKLGGIQHGDESSHVGCSWVAP